MRQLPLDLGHAPAFGRADFLVAPCNSGAVTWLERWPDWPSHGLVVWGPEGCGKSHLLSAFAAVCNGEATVVAAAGLETTGLPALVEAFRVILIDDIQALTDETALFHLHNLAREAGRFLVLASTRAPARLDLKLPDLASRLRALPAVEIGAPDDALLGAILVKQFSDRQLKIGAEVVSWLVGRMERSFAAARDVVEALDQASLAEHRAITVPLARAVLESRQRESS